MRIVTIICYVLAGLTTLQYALALVLVLVSSARMMMVIEVRQFGNSMLAIIIVFLMITLFHAAWVVVWLFCAESVKIFVDIQSNTEETAFYTKRRWSAG